MCYYLHNRTLINLDRAERLCGPSISGAQSCCVPEDTCVEGSICHYTRPAVGGSGYYISGCTDPAFLEPCSKSYTDWQFGDIVLIDASTNLWACCYQDLGANRDCSNPGNETFYALSPEPLGISSSTTASSATSSINSGITPSSTPSTSVSTPISTSTSLTSFPILPASSPPSFIAKTYAPSSALSTGTKARIGIAASIAGLESTVIVGCYLLRKRRRLQHQETSVVSASDELTPSLPPTSEPTHVAVEKSSDQQWELDGNGRSEMEGRGRFGLES